MAGVKLNHIYKVYPNGVKAVNDFTMDIEDKEFIVFVGPSGCGKSTTLRMIAGLEEITAGELRIGDVVVNDVEPKDRDIAMVFQNYALYPHMTVYDNMAFGLKLRKVPKDEIDRKVKEAAGILGITEYLDRKPKEMSGGQRQRVALGRAIVREPKVFLLDEPLSNLDAKLRTAMRSEISKLHHKLQTTFIYVTHDQVEAMTMGTRIVVMKDGFVQQIDTPRNLYRYPSNKFVAGFIGTPQMNFFKGTLLGKGDEVEIKLNNTGVVLNAPVSYFRKTKKEYLDGEKPIVIGLRAEHISVDAKEYPFTAKCRVSHVEELGTDCQVYGDFNLESEDTVAESETRVIVKAPAGSEYEVGDIIEVSLDLTHIHAFDAETEETISPRIPEEAVVDGTVANGVLNALGTKIKLPQAVIVNDGAYRVKIPTDAISLGGNISAKVIAEENVNGQRLVHLDVAGNIMFVKVGVEEKVSESTAISVDLKQITLTSGDEVAAAPLSLVNALSGKLCKRKIAVEKEVNGKVKKVNEWKFSLSVGEAEFDCSQSLASRLISGGGVGLFNSELELQFSPYQVKTGGEGIACEVVELKDYGAETFAVCKVGDKYVNVAVDKDFDAKQTNLALDAEETAIIEVSRAIRLA